jgi:alcohol dehydrogenase class IV
MPYVMAWNAPVITDELSEIAKVVGLAGPGDVIVGVEALFARIGIPSTLCELGLEESRIGWVAEQSIGITRLIQNNPRPLNLTEMHNLVTAAYHGDRSCLN